MNDTNTIEISNLKQLAHHATLSGQNLKMTPGVYSMAEYLDEAVLAEIRRSVPSVPGRPPVWMMQFSGSDNSFDLRGVTLEIETELYPQLPTGYLRCLFISGSNNRFDGLTIRNTGANQGSNGNIVSVWGENNTLENITLHVWGSFPYGYGDLLGKGGPSPFPLQKQSGLMLSGEGHLLRRCKVFSRAFGHCFYIQGGGNIRLEDCTAQGVMRPTNDMLRDESGPAFDLGFRSVYENRDGRYFITPGYMKCLCEDGFRTYGLGGHNGRRDGDVTFINCTAINTRAGFEIVGSESGQTALENCLALGCERAYLLGSNTKVRQSRGDMAHGPLLYLRGGHSSDIELELVGKGSDYTVHTVATIAGSNHRVRLFAPAHDFNVPRVPLMLGFGMPDHAEMSSPIRPAPTQSVHLVNELPGILVIQSEQAADCNIETTGAVVSDEESKKPSFGGSW